MYHMGVGSRGPGRACHQNSLMETLFYSLTKMCLLDTLHRQMHYSISCSIRCGPEAEGGGSTDQMVLGYLVPVCEVIYAMRDNRDKE